MLKQGVGFISFGVVLGIAVGYLLWGIAPISVSSPLQRVPASVSATTTEHHLAPAQPQLALTQPLAKVSGLTSNNTQHNEQLTLPDGLSFTLSKTELPDFFVPDATPLSADNYQQALQQLSREDAALYVQLNDSLFGLLEYDNPQEYRRLLQYGLPTPEELRYVYSKPLRQLRKEMHVLTMKMLDLSEEGGIGYQSQALSRMNALVRNRVLDELVSEYKQYNPAYKDGDPMAEKENWPSHLKELHQEVILSIGLISAPDNVIDKISKFKMYRSISATPLPAENVAVYLGVINQYSPHVVTRYIGQHPLTAQQEYLFSLVATIK
jgi:hypothetical protein